MLTHAEPAYLRSRLGCRGRCRGCLKVWLDLVKDASTPAGCTRCAGRVLGPAGPDITPPGWDEVGSTDAASTCSSRQGQPPRLPLFDSRRGGGVDPSQPASGTPYRVRRAHGVHVPQEPTCAERDGRCARDGASLSPRQPTTALTPRRAHRGAPVQSVTLPPPSSHVYKEGRTAGARPASPNKHKPTPCGGAFSPVQPAPDDRARVQIPPASARETGTRPGMMSSSARATRLSASSRIACGVHRVEGCAERPRPGSSRGPRSSPASRAQDPQQVPKSNLTY